MKMRLAACCFVVILALDAGAQTKLEHKIQPNSTFKAESVVKIDQKLNIAGMDVVTNVEVFSTAKFSVGQRDDNGRLPVETSVDALRISIKSAGSEYQFDSVNPDKEGGSPLEILRGVHKAIVRCKTKVIYDETNRVVAVESDKDALAALSPEVQALAAGQLDAEYLKKQTQQQLDQIPSEPIKQGDSWERRIESDLGAKQILTLNMRYTYDGTVEMNNETLDKITVKTLTAELAFAADAPLPIKLKESKLKVAESDGVLLFSRQRGQIVQDNSTIHIKGDLTFTVGDQELPSTLDLTFKTESAIRE